MNKIDSHVTAHCSRRRGKIITSPDFRPGCAMLDHDLQNQPTHGGLTMPQRHMRCFAFAIATMIAGSTLGIAQAADPVRIPDANPAVTRDLSGHITKARDMRALPAAPGQELKGVAPDSQVTPIHPSDIDRKAGGAFRTPEKAGGTLTPIGTLNIVRGEQPRAPVVNTIAERPSQRADSRF